ncbi:potassium channel family protein [Hydrogenimonas sp.]
MRHLSARNNFLYLALSLVGLLFASALTNQYPDTLVDDIFSVVLVATLVVGIKSLHTEATWRRVVYILAAVLGGTMVLVHLYPGRLTAFVALLVLLLFFAGSFKVAVRRILFEGVVDLNKIVGSFSLYLLIGLIWTVLYLMLLLFDPHAFNGIEVADWRHIFARVAYYSFVTLTTLGYGDISPANHLGEFLVIMESVVGIFYMAIFVSSLINLAGKEVGRKGG